MSVERLPPEREHYVLDNLRLVGWCVKRCGVLPGNINFEDYYQTGCVGLILAAIRFDENAGKKFISFAVPYIYGTIQTYRYHTLPAVKVGRRAGDQDVTHVLKLMNQGCTDQEIMEITGVDAWYLNTIHGAFAPLCLDAPLTDKDGGGKTTFGDLQACKDDDLTQSELQTTVEQIIEDISQTFKNDLKRAIWEEWAYSAIYDEPLPQKYFVHKYQITQTWVSRIITEGKKQFYKRFFGK